MEACRVIRILPIHYVRKLLPLILLMLLATGCGTRQVSFTINSEPLGSYMVMQVLTPDNKISDWVYLGNTPLVMVREMKFAEIRRATITMKVMKEGYFDQTKIWEGKGFIREFKDKGGIFWNPRLVTTRK